MHAKMLTAMSINPPDTHTHAPYILCFLKKKEVSACLLACHLSVCCFSSICVLCVPQQHVRFLTDITLSSTSFCKAKDTQEHVHKSAGRGALCPHSAFSSPRLLPVRRSSLLTGPGAPRRAGCLSKRRTYSGDTQW